MCEWRLTLGIVISAFFHETSFYDAYFLVGDVGRNSTCHMLFWRTRFLKSRFYVMGQYVLFNRTPSFCCRSLQGCRFRTHRWYRTNEQNNARILENMCSMSVQYATLFFHTCHFFDAGQLNKTLAAFFMQHLVHVQKKRCINIGPNRGSKTRKHRFQGLGSARSWNWDQGWVALVPTFGNC